MGEPLPPHISYVVFGILHEEFRGFCALYPQVEVIVRHSLLRVPGVHPFAFWVVMMTEVFKRTLATLVKLHPPSELEI